MHLLPLLLACRNSVDTGDTAAEAVTTPPSLAVTAPADGAVYNEGEAVAFAAQVADEDEAQLSALTVYWISSLDGELGSYNPDSQGLEDSLSLDTLSAGDHVITATAVDSDGLFARAVVTLTINQAPTAPSISLYPSSPGTDDELSVLLDSESEDPDGAAVSYRYEWYVDGALSTTTDTTVDPAETTRDQEWTVVVTPFDDYTDGPSATATITVGNTAPAYDGVLICELNTDGSESCPALDVVAGDQLLCREQSYSDADGDEESGSALAWTVNGDSVGSSDALDVELVGGDVVTCEATPSDGTEDGDAVSSSLVVDNSAPEITEVSVLPDPAAAGDTLSANYTAVDADGDDVSVAFRWFVNGSVVSGEEGDSLSWGSVDEPVFSRDDTVAVEVTPSDAEAEGAALTSAEVTIENAAPDAPSVEITPDAPYAGSQDIQCLVGIDSEDLDGDTVDYLFDWTVDGAPYSGPSTTDRTGDTIPGEITLPGDVWVCTVTPTDGTDEGEAASASVTVGSFAWIDLAAGAYHTCGLRFSGEVECWGGATEDVGQVSDVPSGTYVDVAAGATHSCALDADGEITCWGDDTYGQSTPPEDATYAAISAGDYHTCALDTDGYVSCWGYDNYNQVADTPAGTFDTLSAGTYHSCALADDFTATCWGWDDYGQVCAAYDDAGDCADPDPAETWLTLSAGVASTCAVNTDSSITCWGWDDYGVVSDTPALGSFYEIATGGYHACAIDTSDVVHCWGDDSYGQVSDAPTLSIYTTLSASWLHTCAIDEDGGAVCWGDDTEGQSSVPE